jgi:hypothetical protein
MTKITGFIAIALLVAPLSPALAQLGNFGVKLPGKSSSSVSAADIDSYLAESQEVALMIGVASVLLNDAKDGRIDRAGSRAKVTAMRGTANAKELASSMSFMKSDDEASKLNAAGASVIEKSIAAASAEDRALIGTALVNLAIGLPRAINLAKETPDMIKSLGMSPSALGQVGKLKDVATLLGLQIKYTADILPLLPRLMSVAKVQVPANAATSKGKDIIL